jgi:hypothetical protein
MADPKTAPPGLSRLLLSRPFERELHRMASNVQSVSPQTRQRIYSPLHRLRGAIRRYILLEALAILVTFLGLWYWLGMGIDFLLFKVTGVDLVQVLPFWTRVAALVLCVLALVALLALRLTRLLAKFRPEALALVLERRFPKLLGDRLITAVELSNDLEEAERLGYSRAMILETVREVSGRVDQIPIREVFNWSRLRRRWLLLVLVMLGFALAAYVGDAIAHRSINPLHFGYRLADVSDLWFERNILLRHSLWPRRALLQLIDFPETGELRIGRDAPSPRLRVRAVKWALADSDAPDGWRPLLWSDLTLALLGGHEVSSMPPALAARIDVVYLKSIQDNCRPVFREVQKSQLPEEFRTAEARPEKFASLDEIEFLLANDAKARPEIEQQAGAEKLRALDDVFAELERRVADPRYRRKLRKLAVPANVTVQYWGKKSSNVMPLTRQQHPSEFAGVLSDLKESVRFYVKGEDFTTYPDRLITLVPAPMLTRLERDEYLPAYHFLRPPADGSADDLKGQKFVRTGLGISLTGSTSRIEILTGGDLVLRGEVDKDLSEARIRYRGQRGGPAEGEVSPVVERVFNLLKEKNPQLKSPAQLRLELMTRFQQDMQEQKKEVKWGRWPPRADKEVSDEFVRMTASEATWAPDFAAFLRRQFPAAVGRDILPGQVEILPVGADKRSFEKRFDHVIKGAEFDFEFTDTDNVKSLRHMVLQPVDDRIPDVDVAVETIRKTPSGHMCTSLAMIPFSGRVRDDSGLSKIEYSVSYSRVESAQATALRAGIAAGVLGSTSPAPLPFELFATPLLVEYIGRLSESREGVIYPPPMPLKTFEEMITERNRDPRFQYGKDRLQELLRQQPQADAMIKQFEIKPNLESLDLLERLPELKRAGENVAIQPRFKMRLTISAIDNNVETGPRSGQNKETFTFLVVPYEELLGEMAKEEETLGGKIRDVYDKMLDARSGIDKVIERTPRLPGSDEFRPVATRMLEVEEAVLKGHDVVQEILNDSNRLLKELQTNRIPETHVKNKETVCNRLDEEIRTLFPRSEEAQAALRKALDDRTPPEPPVVEAARQRQDELLAHLKVTLDLMGDLEALAKAAARLTKIVDSQAFLQTQIQKLLKDLQTEIIDKATGKLKLASEPIVLQKGEKKVVTIDLGRDQFDGELKVSLKVPPDSGLSAPALVRVPEMFPKLQFELEAAKAGEFVIQIVPRHHSGAPVEPYDKEPFELKVRAK